MRPEDLNRMERGVAGPLPRPSGTEAIKAEVGAGVTRPRLFRLDEFRHGIPRAVYEKVTGLKLEVIKSSTEAMTYETLRSALAIGIDVAGRWAGRPKKLELGSKAYLRLEPNVAIVADRDAVLKALGVKAVSVEAIHAIREAFKDAVRLIEVEGARRADGVVLLDAKRVYAIVLREAEEGSPERKEAMAIVKALDEGRRDEALSRLFGIPASERLLRVFLPRFLTLVSPTRPYGHVLATQACPAVLQIHPPGTGKSRFADVMVNVVPSTAMAVGPMSRVSLIYDGQLKAPGIVFKYRHVIRDEFATAPLQVKARDLEGAIKHGIISGERIWTAEGSRGRMIKARNDLYMRRFSNHVRIARGSRIDYEPASASKTIHEAIATIFARLGFAEGMARARRFTRLDITRTGWGIEGVTDGMNAQRRPTGLVVHPKVMLTVISRLRRRPEILARRGILAERQGKRMPRLRDAINTSTTLKRLDERRENLVDHLLDAPRQAGYSTIPAVEPRLDHAMDETLIREILPEEEVKEKTGEGTQVETEGETEASKEAEAGEEAETSKEAETSTETSKEAEAAEEDSSEAIADEEAKTEKAEEETDETVYEITESPAEVAEKLGTYRAYGLEFYTWRYDDSVVYLAVTSRPRRILCDSSLCLGFPGSLDRAPEWLREKILEVIRHGSAREKRQGGVPRAF